MFYSGSIIVKDFFLDVLGEILYFPIWWYTRGLLKTALFCWGKIKGGWRGLSLGIILTSFFKPMYGQRGWDAYVLSLAARCVQVVWRFIVIILWAAFWICVLLVWFLLPLFLIYQLF